MTDPVSDPEFQALLDSARQAGLAQPAPASGERRSQPRIAVKHTQLMMAVNTTVTPVDVSQSGIALLSDHAAKAGTSISITVDNTFAVAATVIACTMEASDDALLEAKYRLHCTFEDADAGKLLALQLVQGELGAG